MSDAIKALEAAYLEAMRDAWRARDRFHNTLSDGSAPNVSASKQAQAHAVWAAEKKMADAFAALALACREADEAER